MPVSAETMNYSSAMAGGLTLVIVIFYPWQCRNGFRGPVEAVRNISVVDVIKVDEE
jgi:choline transport protein